MHKAVPDEGAQVDGTIGHRDGMTANAIGHIELQRDEVEAVDVFPVIEPTEDFPVVPEIENGVVPKLVVEAKRLGFNRSKTFFRTHKTDNCDYTIRIIWPPWYLQLGWRPGGTLDAVSDYWPRNSSGQPNSAQT